MPNLRMSTAGVPVFIDSSEVAWPVGYFLFGSKTWDAPSSANEGASPTTTLPVPGAALGDPVVVSLSSPLNGCQLTGYVSAADVVTAVLHNDSGVAVDVASGTLQARVGKFS